MSLKDTIYHLFFILTCQVIGIYYIILHILYQPYRLLFRSSVGTTARPVPPKVKIEVHNPPPTYSTPVDTIFLLHGFPDGPSLWADTVAALTEQGNRCLVAAMPGALGEPVERALMLEETLALLSDAVREVTTEPVTFIGHDWGAGYGRTLDKQNPGLFHRLVFLDVGSYSLNSGFGALVYIAMTSYQCMLALAYQLGEPMGTRLVQLFCRVVVRYEVREIEELTSGMAYHYVWLVKAMISQSGVPVRDRKEEGNERGEENTKPILFVYGKKKAFMFHDARWQRKVRASPGGLIVPLDCGHWITHERPEEWNTVVCGWLEKTMSHVRR